MQAVPWSLYVWKWRQRDDLLLKITQRVSAGAGILTMGPPEQVCLTCTVPPICFLSSLVSLCPWGLCLWPRFSPVLSGFHGGVLAGSIISSSVQLPVSCETICQFPANLDPLSRDSKLRAGVGRLVWRCPQTTHQKHPSVTAFLVLRGHIKNMVWILALLLTSCMTFGNLALCTWISTPLK